MQTTLQTIDIYMRLTDEEKKVFDTIKQELSKEFVKGKLYREEAIQTLSTRYQFSIPEI